MKSIINLLCLLFFVSSMMFAQGGGSQPEFYFHLQDSPGAYYTIYAEKVGNAPVFNRNFQPTQVFNAQYEHVDEYGNPIRFYAQPEQYTSNKGFD